MKFVATFILAAGALLPVGVATAQAVRPVFSVPDWIEIEETDAGHVDVLIPWTLSVPTTVDVTFTWYVESSEFGATPGIDYVDVPPTQVTIPAGQTAGNLVLRVIGDTNYESNEFVRFHIEQLYGATTQWADPSTSQGLVYILGDDPAAEVPTLARADYVYALTNGGLNIIHVYANDAIATEDEEEATHTLVTAPAHGSVQLVPYGQSSPIPKLSAFHYTPNQDFGGRDGFRYRLCDGSGVCSEADVVIDVAPTEVEEAYLVDRSGGQIIGLPRLPALEDTVYEVSPLTPPVSMPFEMPGDTTPYDAWDAGSPLDWRVFTIPPRADGGTVEYRIIADPTSADVDDKVEAYMGVDTNGNGRPDKGEQGCLQSGGAFLRYCVLRLTVGDAPVSYWVAAHSRLQDHVTGHLRVYELPLDQSDGSLVVTGPVTLENDGLALLRLAWQDDALLPGDRRLGFVTIRSRDYVGEFPFWLLPSSSDRVPLPLRVGIPRQLALAAESTRDGIFVDVPEGATRLDVTSQSAAGVDFYLARHPGNADMSSSVIEDAPPADQATSVSSGAGDQRTASVTGASLAPGRWYVVPSNATSSRAVVTLTANIQAVAPVVRPGSYFNPDRPGSGLFLYPAGDQWAGLWYTYDYSTSRPTWYYLQAPAPGVEGTWKSPVYRQAWYGTHARPTVVGWATVTPSGPDAFVFTYRLDGIVGSESFSPLGRGCPSLGGAPVDVSSHWFDPASAGTGYSVQMWTNYEFLATFFYDKQGWPMHLTAERNGFGGSTATLDLQRLEGRCPTCNYGEPIRNEAGTLTRTISGGRITRIDVDADYVESWPFPHVPNSQSRTDNVQLLGGPGTSQGCEP